MISLPPNVGVSWVPPKLKELWVLKANPALAGVLVAGFGWDVENGMTKAPAPIPPGIRDILGGPVNLGLAPPDWRPNAWASDWVSLSPDPAGAPMAICPVYEGGWDRLAKLGGPPEVPGAVSKFLATLDVLPPADAPETVEQFGFNFNWNSFVM